ncbi:tetratricopeptide repeat protein 29 [Echeneis naucrates]|uniref:tetratricopeptide repeat protein 29 n=1 Tax=Echeneis naucrates TaxID=173247 RepID=UPI001114022C|nr:tetratricopeptide repeat protein 29 [Echeneis naucrates]
MKAVVTRQHTASFLPQIPTNSNKWKGGTPYRVRQEKKSDKSTQILSREQIAQFRNSLKQNISVQLLQEGYHRSFSEFFSLLQSEQSRIEAADPSSDLRLQTPLEDQPDKLEAMRLHLSHAEQAERIGSWSKVCEQRLLVAQFFSAPEDLWLRLHFYHSCADREQGGRSRPATEARACMADIYLQQGDLLEATHQAELCYQQAEDGGWLDSTGRPLRLRAQQTLWEIYTRRADALLDAAKYKEALKLLHRGHSIITESEDKQGEGEATYRLGMAYQRSGDHDTAKKFLNTSMQIYDRLQDAEGLVKAYKVWVTSVERYTQTQTELP